MGKKQELEETIANLEWKLQATERDNAAHRARESARMRSDRQAEQARLKEAERKERHERIEQLGAGLLPLKGATQWAIVREEDGREGIEVFVPLSEAEQRQVQEHLRARERKITVPDVGKSLRDLIERAARVQGYATVAPNVFDHLRPRHGSAIPANIF